MAFENRQFRTSTIDSTKRFPFAICILYRSNKDNNNNYHPMSNSASRSCPHTADMDTLTKAQKIQKREKQKKQERSYFDNRRVSNHNNKSTNTSGLRQEITPSSRSMRSSSVSRSSYNLSGSERSGVRSFTKSASRRRSRRSRCSSIIQKVLKCLRIFYNNTISFVHDDQVGASIAALMVSICAIASFTFEALFLPKNESAWCGDADISEDDWQEYKNPDYDANPCLDYRTHYLIFLTQRECVCIRRMVYSIIIGAAAGIERKSADRPAGVRTMSLVSLGSCFFTLSSISAFKSSSMHWDSSRVSAAIPKGVGFLAASLIWKGTVNGNHEVRGLNTAATVWISAAAGVGVGGGLYFITTYTVVCVLIVLRFGPQLYLETFEDTDSDSDGEVSSGDDDSLSLNPQEVSKMEVDESSSLLSAGSSARTAKHASNLNFFTDALGDSVASNAVDLSAPNKSSSKRHKARVAMYRD